MPQLTDAERLVVMGDVIQQIQGAGYVYDLGKGESNWAQIPPPRGSKLNCQAAARLAKRMEEEQGVDGLKIIATNIADGFFVPSAPGVKALGSNQPPVRTLHVSGWEFDNHYRVKDTRTNKVYDLTFGTSGNFNPVGVKCTSTEVDFPKMISIYGGKYKIIRSNIFEAQLLPNAQVPAKDLVEDKDYE